MNKRLKQNGLLSLVLVLSLLMSMPVCVLAEEPDENIITVEETPEETASDTVEEAPEIICEPVEPAVEEAGEVLLSEAAVEAPVTDETVEIADAAENIPLEGISDMDETASDFTDEQPTEPQEEADEGLLDNPDVEELAEEDDTSELPTMDLEQSLNDMTDESTSTATDLSEEADVDTDFFSVGFDLRGHGEAIEPVRVASGSTVEKPEDPKADGFVFIGWYRESSCERLWFFDTDTVTENLTLYAGWEEIQPEETVEQAEEAQQLLDPDEEPVWSLSLPGSQPIAYKAEITEIGTISVQDAWNFTEGQAISVTLDYSSFSGDTYSIPIEITVMQNGTERTWSAGTSISLSPDGSDPITVFVNIGAEDWAAAPHGAYAMSLVFHSALAGR